MTSDRIKMVRDEERANEYVEEIQEYTTNLEKSFMTEGSFLGVVIGDCLRKHSDFQLYKRFTAIMETKNDKGGVVKRQVLESVLASLELAFGVATSENGSVYAEKHVYEFADDIAECAKEYAYDFYRRNLYVSEKIKKGQSGRTDEEYLENLSDGAVAGVRKRIANSKGGNQ